ncbi:MAG: ShlB/FhaC/HecB family hemolysin secretion/activation protein, partial [Alkalinema sp. RL_2_19]|nr:ShlB/FhaC/HecB family hemolysin secretion/activation protein [Alkalinema sp. RL_2_19]
MAFYDAGRNVFWLMNTLLAIGLIQPMAIAVALPHPVEVESRPSPDINMGDRPPDQSLRLTVDRFEVTGSTKFGPEELAAVTAPYRGRELSFEELLQVRSAITQLYVERGYLTTGAVLPPQTLTGGVVQIQVLEGTLGEIEITGNRRLGDRYIRDRIRPIARTPLNVPKLLEGLQQLRLNPRIANISADLQADVQPGRNRLKVEITEANTFSTNLSLDNGR